MRSERKGSRFAQSRPHSVLEMLQAKGDIDHLAVQKEARRPAQADQFTAAPMLLHALRVRVLVHRRGEGGHVETGLLCALRQYVLVEVLPMGEQ